MNHARLHSSIVMSHVNRMPTPHGPCAKAQLYCSESYEPHGCSSWTMCNCTAFMTHAGALAQPLMTHSVTGHVSMVTFVDM